MKIGIICSSGSPIGLIPDDIGGKGVGGAELALMSTAEKFVEQGHSVIIYNNPRVPGTYRGVHYQPLGDWIVNDREVAILFRTPYRQISRFNGKKIFWSCDQFTEGDFNTDIFPFVDRVVTISDYHTKFFLGRYNIKEDKITTIPIGVRTWEYEQPVEKVPGRIIFCSVPDRGLDVLRVLWPHLKQRNPDLSLVITSDYRLWGAVGPMNEEYRYRWQGLKDVTFLGKIPRSDLVVHQLQAEWMFYPCIYDELFCIAAAECQVAGAIPITSSFGALSTTNSFGIQIAGDPRSVSWQGQFLDMASACVNKSNEIREMYNRKAAAKVFGFDNVLLAWDEVLHE